MTTRWFGALLITATALTPVAAPVFAANATPPAMMVRDDVAVRESADRAVRPVQARVMTQAAPTTPAASTSPNFQDRRDGGGRHGGGNGGGGHGGGGGGGGWGGGNRGSSTTATPAPAPAPRADRSGGGQWQGRSGERGGYTRPAPTVESNAGGNVHYQRRGYDRPVTSPTPNAGADIQYQRRGGDAGYNRGTEARGNRGDQGRSGGYNRGGYNGGGVVVTQPAPRYDRQRNDDRRIDNRGYDNRGHDNRGYDNHGRDDRRYDNRGNDGRRYDNGRYGNGRHNGYASWNQGWRNDRRYDWVNYRARYGSQFSLGRYYVPYRNWNYRRLTIGFSLWPLFYSDRYWINDPWSYRLPDVYGPYRWVRYYDDAILVDVETGEVVDTIYDFFW